MLGQSAIDIFKSEKRLHQKRQSGGSRECFRHRAVAEIRSGNVLSGKSTSEKIDAAIELQSEQSRFGVLPFGSEGIGQAVPGSRAGDIAA